MRIDYINIHGVKIYSGGWNKFISIIDDLVNNIHMAKRKKAAGRRQKSHSHKTKKRLEIKRLMLEEKAKKKKRK